MSTTTQGNDRERADRELFDAIGVEYARKDIVASTRIARRSVLVRAVETALPPGERLGTLVDVGCGAGSQAIYLAGLYDRYIGIDQSQAMVDIASRLTEKMPNVEFVCANFKDADIPPGSVDTVLFAHVLHHMTDIETVFAAARHVAKPGGRLIAIEPQRGNPLIQGLRWIRTKIDPSYSPDQHFFDRSELQAVMENSNLAEIQLVFQSFLTQPFATVILNPQAVFHPLSRLAVTMEPLIEKLLAGPLARLSWLLTATATFPRQDGSG